MLLQLTLFYSHHEALFSALNQVRLYAFNMSVICLTTSTIGRIQSYQ